MSTYINPADFYGIDEPDPTWAEPYDTDLGPVLYDEWLPQDLWDASVLGHPYSYLASQAVDHAGMYFSTQADWYEWITPRVKDELDEIPF